MDLVLNDLYEADVRPLANLHRRAFPHFFLSSLGEPFLVQFYRGFVSDPSAVCVVAKDEADHLLGGVVGTVEPTRLFRRMLRRQWPGFVTASLSSIWRTPAATPRLLAAVRYRGGVNKDTTNALLSSICVEPALQGTGVGRHLIDEWTRRMRRRGVTGASLTTDALDNDVVNAFYLAGGWRVSERFTTAQGRQMHRYTITLDPR